MRRGELNRMVGRRIRFYRRNRPGGLLPQAHLAERVGVSISTLKKVEQGDRPISVPLLEDIACELRVSPHDLLCGPAHSGTDEDVVRPFIAFSRRHAVSVRDAETVARLLDGFWCRLMED